MKLIIQIPCLDEAERLPITWRDLPKSIPGVDVIEVLVIDDGSTDRTSAVAGELGAHHVLQLGRHRGLARAFQAGIREALRLGADIVVNTDADNQYCGSDILRLIEPILEKGAEIVIGDRGVTRIPYFSPLKRRLQRIGSRVVQAAAGIPVPDAASGFRAYSRNAARQIDVLTDFSYTMETVIQAGQLGIPLVYIPITTNPPTGPSRLVRSIPHYVLKSASAIIRTYTRYQPMRVLAPIGAVLFGVGTLTALPLFRWLAEGTKPGQAEPSLSSLLGVILIASGIVIVGTALAAHRKKREKIELYQHAK
jgi:glycosyltransferase involved in cell wall biosynthesis